MKRRKTAAGLLAASLLVGAAPVVTNAAPVRIVSTSITEQSSSGYRVNVTFSADAGVILHRSMFQSVPIKEKAVHILRIFMYMIDRDSLR